jgi:hypothetical protein
MAAELDQRGSRVGVKPPGNGPFSARRAAYAARNGATFLVLGDLNERDTGAAYPIYKIPPHFFIDRDGVIRSIVLEDMDTAQGVAEASRLFEESPVDAESDVVS